MIPLARTRGPRNKVYIGALARQGFLLEQWFAVITAGLRSLLIAGHLQEIDVVDFAATNNYRDLDCAIRCKLRASGKGTVFVGIHHRPAGGRGTRVVNGHRSRGTGFRARD